MSEYLRHLVNTTNRIEGACREIRECASQLAVENSNSVQQLKNEIAALKDRLIHCKDHDLESTVVEVIEQMRQLSAV
jgi:hypothetical protein